MDWLDDPTWRSTERMDEVAVPDDVAQGLDHVAAQYADMPYPIENWTVRQIQDYGSFSLVLMEADDPFRWERPERQRIDRRSAWVCLTWRKQQAGAWVQWLS